MTQLITVEELLTDPDFAQTLVLRRNSGAYNKYGEWSTSSMLTGSTDASPSALQGDLYWYDIGKTENGVAVLYDTATASYAFWTHATLGAIFTAVADVGSTPTDYFALPDYPLSIEVTGAGSASSNGSYALSEVPPSIEWTNSSSGNTIVDVGSGGPTVAEWQMGGDPVFTDYTSSTASKTQPPKDSENWSVAFGTPPTPALEYEIPTNQYIGVGSWSGTLTLDASASALSDLDFPVVGAWQKATDKELVQIDLGEIKQEVRKLLTLTEVKVSEDDDKLSDRLIWNGKRYKVLHVGDNRDNGYYRAFASFEGVE